MSRILTFFIVLLFMSSQAQADIVYQFDATNYSVCLLYTSPSPRD